jgi:hypothetical protein
MKSSCHDLIPFLPFFSITLLCFFISPRHVSCRKHNLTVVEKACLLVCWLAMDVLLLGTCASAGMFLLSRCLTIVYLRANIASNIDIVTTLCNVTTDGVWIEGRIYWTLMQRVTIFYSTHTLMSTVTSPLPLLGSGFQRWAFPFLYLLTYLRSCALLEEPLIGQRLKNFATFHGSEN